MVTWNVRDMQLTEREELLIRYIRSLDRNKRHRLLVVCRGCEPWEIDEHIAQTKVDLTGHGKQNK
jgi:hypothetical protein